MNIMSYLESVRDDPIAPPKTEMQIPRGTIQYMTPSDTSEKSWSHKNNQDSDSF